MTALLQVPLAPIAIARAEIERGSKSFAMASKLLDQRTRDQTAVVYAFCRRADDAVDEVAPEEQPAAVVRLTSELSAIYGGVVEDPVLAAFNQVAWERAIPRHYPAELIAGMLEKIARLRALQDAEDAKATDTPTPRPPARPANVIDITARDAREA